MGRLASARLYGILDLGYVAEAEALRMATKMLRGGVQVLQLRAKNYAPETLLPLARELAHLCHAHDVPFIVNDHASLIAPSGAHGIHVGQDDLSVSSVRETVGPSSLVGLSTHSIQQATAATHTSADYIGFGPLFATPTKPDYVPIGTDDLSAVHESVPLPIFCIGGIHLHNLREVLACGARRVVMVSAILLARDVEGTCSQARDILEEA